MSANRPRLALWIGALLVLVLFAVFAALPAVSVVKSVGPRTALVERSAEDMLRYRAFVAAQLETTRDPLLSLAIDPVEGTATILLSGVPLRTVQGADASVSYALRGVRPDSMVMARLTGRDGMIPPEPIRRVDAPADTAEANQAPAEVPVETTPAAVNLRLDNGIVIRITPNDLESRDRWAVWRFRAWERLRENAVSAWDGLRLAPPRIAGEVTLEAPNADAKALYRALSDGSPVVIRTVSR